LTFSDGGVESEEVSEETSDGEKFIGVVTVSYSS
jgi:hypothetical protein